MKRVQLLSAFLVCSLAGAYVAAQDPQQPASPSAQQQQGEAPSGEAHRRDTTGPGDAIRELFQSAISGTVETVTADGATIKRLDGSFVTIKTAKDTMFFRDRQQAKLADFKPGDHVIVAGEHSSDNTVMAKVMAERPNGPNAMNPEDLGKKFIVGEVTKIDGTKLTIKRVDGIEQTIEVDDDTSFRNAKRESITLPDVKVGERVLGRGELKDGVFVPAMLMVGMPQPGEGFRMHRRDRGEAPKDSPSAPQDKKTPENTPK